MVLKRAVLVVFFLVFMWSSPDLSAADDPAGVVKFVAGEVFIASVDSSVKAVPNMKVHSGDVIRTSSEGYVGIIFDDDTVLSLGPSSEFALDDFQFDPAGQKLSFIARMLKGTFSFLSGQIANLAPQQVKLATPDATLGIRGTKLLVKVE